MGWGSYEVRMLNGSYYHRATFSKLTKVLFQFHFIPKSRLKTFTFLTQKYNLVFGYLLRLAKFERELIDTEGFYRLEKDQNAWSGFREKYYPKFCPEKIWRFSWGVLALIPYSAEVISEARGELLKGRFGKGGSWRAGQSIVAADHFGASIIDVLFHLVFWYAVPQ